MKCIHRFFRRRQLQKNRINYRQWHQITGKIPLLTKLSTTEKARLRRLTSLFLSEKTLVGANGLHISRTMELTIAAQACLLILNLSPKAFNGWVEIVVYPGAFKVNRDFTDGNGLVHSENQTLSGESWDRGPLILSWDSVEQESYQLHPGHNVIIHEFAHKLDMLNGRANGMPPLHPDMPIEHWTQALSSAYDLLNRNLSRFQKHKINPYAATNPAEFFAVISEYFFTAPDILLQYCPDVYQQLKQYYRQDPVQRFNH